MHRNMLLPVDFLTFPEQDGPRAQAISGQSQSAVPCESGQSSIVDNQEDAQSRTMTWLMQSPVQAEMGSESVSEGSDLCDASLVFAMETCRSEELPDCAFGDFEHASTHAH